MIVMRHPMDIFLDNFTEGAPLDRQDLPQEVGLRVEIVLVVLAAKDLEGFEYVVNIFG